MYIFIQVAILILNHEVLWRTIGKLYEVEAVNLYWIHLLEYMKTSIAFYPFIPEDLLD